ncbi:hypothetical protein PENSPDRAFT_666353 [Peniophora sp. CONT]|nr:hypothetical protein PENSPDRAFT_666353 [Peniophora sp. CONT]
MQLNKPVPEYKDGLMCMVFSSHVTGARTVPYPTLPMRVYQTASTLRTINTSMQRPRHIAVPVLSRLLGFRMPGYHHDGELMPAGTGVTEWWKKLVREDFPSVQGAAYACLITVGCPQGDACICLADAMFSVVARAVARHGPWHRPTILGMGLLIRGDVHYIFLIFSSRALKAYTDIYRRPHVPLHGPLAGYSMAPVFPVPASIVHVDEAFAKQAERVIGCRQTLAIVTRGIVVNKVRFLVGVVLGR